jgi:ectoine hydroxylase-related dioxygenase (phytanoyl-CoA dioxygenase family)
VPELERLDATAGSGPLCAALTRDGACVVEGAVSTEHLAGLNHDLEALISTTTPQMRNPNREVMERFYGTKTIRLDGLPAKSDTFVRFMLDPAMHDVCQHFLLPNCPDYLLNTAQLIQIGPGENAQRLHRDEEAWPNMPHERPELSVEALIALNDFTVENGATQVVPGSHRWARGREPEPTEITHAVMKAGSAVYYLGSTLHGGGANVTQNESRRGLFYGYVVGWLRTAENMFLTVPLDKVRHMPTRVQELLGYKPLDGVGLVDVGSPMALLE